MGEKKIESTNRNMKLAVAGKGAAMTKRLGVGGKPKARGFQSLLRDLQSGKLGNKTSLAPVFSRLVNIDDVESNSKLDDLVREGLPVEFLDKSTELIRMMIDFGVLPRKTIEDARKGKKGKLSSANSERIIRVVRMIKQTIAAVGEERAVDWIQKPNKRFGGACALEMVKTESGARAVEQFLLQLSHGFAA